MHLKTVSKNIKNKIIEFKEGTYLTQLEIICNTGLKQTWQ